jgi:hypothetical protein
MEEIIDESDGELSSELNVRTRNSMEGSSDEE